MQTHLPIIIGSLHTKVNVKTDQASTMPCIWSGYSPLEPWERTQIIRTQKHGLSLPFPQSSDKVVTRSSAPHSLARMKRFRRCREEPARALLPLSPLLQPVSGIPHCTHQS